MLTNATKKGQGHTIKAKTAKAQARANGREKNHFT